MAKLFQGYITQLYYFNNIKYNTLTMEQKNAVLALKNKVLNELPFIGGFCSSKATLEDVKIQGDTVKFTFKFEMEVISQTDGRPVRHLSNVFVENINFLSKGIATITSKEEINYEKVLSIVNVIPSYISLILNPGFQFKYMPPSFQEVRLEEDKLSYIKVFLENNLMVDKGKEEDFFSLISTTFKDGFLLTASASKGKPKMVEYFLKDKEDKKVLSINCNGGLFSSLKIEENTFKELVNLIYILYKIPRLGEILKPVDKIMEEYLSFIHKESTFEARIRQTSLIIQDVKEIIKVVLNKEVISSIYITLAINIFINLAKHGIKSKDYCIKIDYEEYWVLVDFLKLYTRKKYNLVLSVDKIEDLMCKVSHLIQLSQGEEEKLIALFRKEMLNV